MPEPKTLAGSKGFTGVSVKESEAGKESACNAGSPGLIPGSGRSPGEGIGYPLQYSWLENPMAGGGWQATVHGVAKSQTRLNDFTFILSPLIAILDSGLMLKRLR